MDIYEFINSKDIREHCRKLNHKFNTLESAYIVYQSEKTIAERHAAFREIIETMPDMEFKRSNLIDVDYDSLHQFLREYIDAENRRLDEFKAKDTSVYIANHDDGIFSDWQSCVDYYINDNREEITTYLFVSKKEIKSSANDVKKIIKSLGFDYSKAPVRFTSLSYYDQCFESLWIEVPTPFKKGDIVYDPAKSLWGYSADYPFVLTHLCTWEDEKRLERKRRSADRSGMTASGYFWDHFSESTYGDCMHCYLNLEYYPHKLEGKYREQEAISSFLKGNIGLERLLKAIKIINQEESLYRMRHLGHLNYRKEILELAGLE